MSDFHSLLYFAYVHLPECTLTCVKIPIGPLYSKYLDQLALLNKSTYIIKDPQYHISPIKAISTIKEDQSVKYHSTYLRQFCGHMLVCSELNVHATFNVLTSPFCYNCPS